MKVRRSKTLPWPPVILAIIPLPQRMSQAMPIISNSTITIIVRLMILRFFDTGFFTFFGLELLRVSVVVCEEVLAVFSFPSCSSKSKIWVGLRKSSAAEVLTGSDVDS